MKKTLIFILAVAAIIAGVFLFRHKIFSNFAKPPITYVEEVKDAVTPHKEEIIKEEKIDGNGNTVKKEETVIPGKVFIKVPFTSQAPFGVWDERHEEACEEATIVMLNAYLEKKELTKEIAEKKILDLIQYQLAKYNHYHDTDAQKTASIYSEFFGPPLSGRKLKVIYDFNKIELKKELARGEPIIIPAAGRELHNPYYKQPGPLYHMLVLVGYSGDEIITNDPGTRRGEGYRYDIDILYNAIHDFPGEKDKITEGRKAMIVLE